jgi:hypothetical protein
MENNINRDEEIRDKIIAVLHKAYRNPKGKFRHMTFSILHREMRDIMDCEREDLLRELRFLTVNNVIELKKERYPSRFIYKTKIPASVTEYYVLSGKILNKLEQPSKYTSDAWTQKSNNVIKIENSTINAPVTAGQQIVVSHNPQFDLQSIIELIEQNKTVANKEETVLFVKENLGDLLENPESNKTKTFFEKLKNLGQQWLIPVITQFIASYLVYKAGIN